MSIDWCKKLSVNDSRIGKFCYIYKSCLCLNSNATQAILMSNTPFVLLGYDRERNIIAIKPLKEPEMGVRKIVRQKHGGSTIGMLTFLKYYPEIEFQRKISYCPVSKENDYFVCDLNKGEIE